MVFHWRSNMRLHNGAEHRGYSGYMRGTKASHCFFHVLVAHIAFGMAFLGSGADKYHRYIGEEDVANRLFVFFFTSL